MIRRKKYIKRSPIKRKSGNKANTKTRVKKTKENYQIWLQAQPTKELIKELDRVFSLYVRQRDADHAGLVKCCTCSKVDHWRKLHCGHFFSRRYLSLRFDERNTGPQCPGCNIFNQGAGPQFSIYLTRKHGAQILELLEVKKNNTWKAGKFEYIALINEYLQKIQNINGEIK